MEKVGCVLIDELAHGKVLCTKIFEGKSVHLVISIYKLELI